MHTALSMTENMLRKESIGNDGTIDCNLGAFPLFNMLASAIPVFALAISWKFWFFFDRGRALRDTTAVAVVSSNWHWKLLYHFISHALSSTSILSLLPISISLMLVTMVLKRGSLVQWFGMSQLVERRIGHSQICGQ